MTFFHSDLIQFVGSQNWQIYVTLRIIDNLHVRLIFDLDKKK